MPRLIFLNSLQALDSALRLGTFRAAAAELGITVAAVGQRIKALEDFLDAPLLLRGPNGVTATASAEVVQSRLGSGFADLRAVADELNLDRESQVRLRADGDWLDLWLAPRLPQLAREHPALRIDLVAARRRDGGADVEVFYGGEERGTALYPEFLIPVVRPAFRDEYLAAGTAFLFEGLPLLHLAGPYGPGVERGWSNWVDAFGQRSGGAERGVRHRSVVEGLGSVDVGAGILLTPLSLVFDRMTAGTLLAVPNDRVRLPARNGFRLKVFGRAAPRRNVEFFLDWLADQARDFGQRLQDGAPDFDLMMELPGVSR